MDATAVGHHDRLFAGVAKEGHHWMDVLAKPLRIKMGNNLIEDFGGPILDRADDAEQPPTGHAAPTPIVHPRLACAGLFAFDLAVAQRSCGQPRALGCAPPSRPGQGKTPEDGFLFIEHNALPLAGPILAGSACERRPRQRSGLRSEPARGAAVADVFFSRVAKSAGGSAPQASRDMLREHGDSAAAEFVADGASPGPAAALARP